MEVTRHQIFGCCCCCCSWRTTVPVGRWNYHQRMSSPPYFEECRHLCSISVDTNDGRQRYKQQSPIQDPPQHRTGGANGPLTETPPQTMPIPTAYTYTATTQTAVMTAISMRNWCGNARASTTPKRSCHNKSNWNGRRERKSWPPEHAPNRPYIVWWPRQSHRGRKNWAAAVGPTV